MRRILISASVNSNTEYTFYIPYFIDFWINQNDSQIEFVPRVICVNFKPQLPFQYMKYCEPVHLESTLSDVTLSQLARYLYLPMDEPDYLITTDIDMMPISSKPFIKALESVSAEKDCFVVMRNVLPPGQFPICYNVASPSVWLLILKEYFRTTDFSKIIHSLEKNSNDSSDWYFDQKLLYELLTSQNLVKIILLADNDTGLRRLDRGRHSFPLNWLILCTGRMSRFTEYHSARPSRETKWFLYMLGNWIKFKS
jgi:hypothetical protein